MKNLFNKLLLILIMIIGVIMILFNLIFSNPYQQPQYTQYDKDNFSYYQEIAKMINKQIISITTTGKISIEESIINKEIDKQLDTNNVIYKSQFLGADLKVDHMWVEINQETLELYGNIRLNNQLGGLKLSFDVSSDDEHIYLNLTKAKFGKLPLLKKVVLTLIKDQLPPSSKLNNNTIVFSKEYINQQISQKTYIPIKVGEITLGDNEIKMSFSIFK